MEQTKFLCLVFIATFYNTGIVTAYNIQTNLEVSAQERKVHERDLTSSCLADIQKGDFMQAYSLLVNSKESQDVDGKLDVCINSAYDGKLQNVQNILAFINTIPSKTTQAYGYFSLFAALNTSNHTRTNEMMLLIYHVKNAMSDSNTSQILLSDYEKLKAKFPADMRAIIFRERVRIRNRAYSNEYLYESSKYANGHRLILSWKPGGPVSQSPFFLEPEVSNGKLYFIITNDFYERGSAMGMSDSYYNRERRKIVGYSVMDSVYLRWFVEPRSSYFTIKNWDNHFIYSPNDQNLYDKERRYLFSWRGDPIDMSSSYNWQWAIEPY